MKLDCKCEVCSKGYTRYYSKNTKIPNRSFCSVLCKGLWQSANLSGNANPNFNNKWDEESRQKQALLVKSKVDDLYKQNCSKANKGKKFSEDRIKRMHNNRSSDSYSKPHTKQSKELIGKKSSEKFKMPGYMVKLRKTMEDNGHWTPLKDKEKMVVYKDACEWISNMFEDLSQEECNYINEIGIFNTRTNQKGMCRDHILSRKDGFESLVFPEILRHPCNCKFILHSDNSSKRGRSNISIEQLFCNIKNYKGDWHEHQRVLDLIESYELGLRWDIEQFIEGFYNV